MISNEPLGLTELIFSIVGIIVGFALSVWYDNRKSREELVFSRSVKSRFDKDDLDRELGQKIQVTYERQSITSVTVFQLRITNVSPKSIANQAFTVTFSKEAKIVSHEIEAPEEMKRFLQRDENVKDDNKIRFTVGVVPRQGEIVFSFTVVGHTEKSFDISHGFLDPKDPALVGGYPTSLDTKVRIVDGNYVNVFETQIQALLYSLVYFFFLGLLEAGISYGVPFPFVTLPFTVLRAVYLLRVGRLLSLIVVRLIPLLAGFGDRSFSVHIEGNSNTVAGGDYRYTDFGRADSSETHKASEQ